MLVTMLVDCGVHFSCVCNVCNKGGSGDKNVLWGNVSAPGARRASFVTRALPVDCCR